MGPAIRAQLTRGLGAFPLLRSCWYKTLRDGSALVWDPQLMGEPATKTVTYQCFATNTRAKLQDPHSQGRGDLTFSGDSSSDGPCFLPRSYGIPQQMHKAYRPPIGGRRPSYIFSSPTTSCSRRAFRRARSSTWLRSIGCWGRQVTIRSTCPERVDNVVSGRVQDLSAVRRPRSCSRLFVAPTKQIRSGPRPRW